MNYELIEEIQLLKSENKTDQEIANFLGMSKQTILLILRIKKVVSDRFNFDLKKLEEENINLKSLISDLENELQQKNNLIDFDCISMIEEKEEQIESLKDELRSCIYFEDRYKETQSRYLELSSDLNRIPKYIRKFFLK